MVRGGPTAAVRLGVQASDIIGGPAQSEVTVDGLSGTGESVTQQSLSSPESRFNHCPDIDSNCFNLFYD